MLTLYPSNRLEDLAILLAELIKIRPKRVLAPTTVLVPNPGMQHWLNMYLADYLGVAMNIVCPMPTRYIWDLSRQVLGDGSVPKHSAFKRDVLCWKIFALVKSTSFQQTSYYEPLSRFWSQADTANEKHTRMFAFARQLADLFEQYLVFRPDWLMSWQQGLDPFFEQQTYAEFASWQKWFWNKIVDDFPPHPVELQFRAIDNLALNKQALPDDVYIFSISSISPIYLRFFDAISQHTQVHLFQLNPCVSYWGDAKSDLVLAKIARKQSLHASLNENDLHPLLRNLGMQGRDLNNLLLDMQHQEISAFEFNNTELDNNVGRANSINLLSQLQQDILQNTTAPIDKQYDGSIAIHACHSPVRELQVLKDVLLDKFKHDKTLQAKDVLVMCPSIEVYSPFIQAIFSQSQGVISAGEEHSNTVFPVSISDRKPVESEPLLVAFMSILGLPMSRFDTTSIIDLIALPNIAQKYQLGTSEIELCAQWTKDACIEWGIDAEHVSKFLEESQNTRSKEFDNKTNCLHTWQWGINRLLTGLINASNDLLVDDVAPVSYIEGQNSVVLGRYLQALEDLEQSLDLLSQSKTLDDWCELLLELANKQLYTSTPDQFALSLLKEAISSLKKNTGMAQYNEAVDISIVNLALQNLLSIPEVRSQFHKGNVTFCSMLPMRSIPFKIIAILGLNQQDFPRQDKPVEIDLMQAERARPGDRSRRGDDRYLFLESLVSARQYLHLSYQYKHVKTNSDRMPSVVLDMLIEHCHTYYSAKSLPIIKHPLHPFSPLAFNAQIGHKGSFDKSWWQHSYTLNTDVKNKDSHNSGTSRNFGMNENAQVPQVVAYQEISKFLKNSLQYFANHRLKIYLANPNKRDFEPEYVFNKGLQYSIRMEAQGIVEQHYNLSEGRYTEDTFSILNEWKSRVKYWLASGELPYLIGMEQTLYEIILDSLALVQYTSSNTNIKRAKACVHIANMQLEYDFEYDLDLGISEIKVNRGEPSLNHILACWVKLLILNVHLKQIGEPKHINANIYYIDDKEASIEHRNVLCKTLTLDDKTNAADALQELMSVYSDGNSKPVLIDLGLANDILEYDSPEKAIASPSLKAKWESRAEQGQDANDFFPHLYFNYLIQDMPEFTTSNLSVYFKCFAGIRQFLTPPTTIEFDQSVINYINDAMQEPFPEFTTDIGAENEV